MVVALFTLVLSPIARIDLAAQEFQYVAPNINVLTNAGKVTLSLPTASAAFTVLPTSIVSMEVPAGESDLFMFEIVSECRISDDAGSFEGLLVQARLNGQLSFAPLGGGVAILQPQRVVPDGGTLCTGPGMHSVSKRWFVRLPGGASGGTWTFSIWWKLLDINQNSLTATLSNRTVTVTRYD